jgi:hypothetical protein
MSPLRRPVLRLRVAHRFGVVLAGLLLAMATLAVVATVGVRRVNQRATEIAGDQLHTTELVGRLTLELADTQQAALRLISSNDPQLQAQLNARLDGDGVKLASSITALRTAVATDPRAERAAVDEVEGRWRAFLDLRRRAQFDAIGFGPEISVLNERLAEDVSHVFAPAMTAAERVLKHEVVQAGEARAAAQETYRSTLRWLFGLVGATVLVAGGLLSWLTRGVVPRVRAYSRYAVEVAGGRLPGRLAVAGSDELADLGHALDAMVRDQLGARDHERAQSEFSHALQTAENEGEAHDLLRRHLQRSISGTSASFSTATTAPIDSRR